jgi:hypothetical protein
MVDLATSIFVIEGSKLFHKVLERLRCNCRVLAT